MEDVLPGMKIVIDNGDGVQKVLPLDSFTGNSSREFGRDTEHGSAECSGHTRFK